MLTLIIKDIKSSFPKNLENETIEKESFDNFKKSLEYLLRNVKNKSEEYNKKHITNYLRDTFYNNDFKVNVDLNKIDSAIFNKSDKSEKPIVIIETKKLKSSEMINQSDANKKSMQKLISNNSQFQYN